MQCPVGPPWTVTSSGGRSPAWSSSRRPGLRGVNTTACTSPNIRCRGTGSQEASSAVPEGLLIRPSLVSCPVSVSNRTTDGVRAGPHDMAATTWPEVVRFDHTVSSVSTKDIVSAFGSRTPRREPCTRSPSRSYQPVASTASLPSGSGALQLAPTRQSGPPISRSSVHNGLTWPSSRTRNGFHQPLGSERATSSSGPRHHAWHTDSSGPPATTRCGPRTPSRTSAAHSWVPSQGIDGWSQPIHAT